MRETFLTAIVAIALLPLGMGHTGALAIPLPTSPSPAAAEPDKASSPSTQATSTAEPESEFFASRNQSIRQTLPLIDALLGQWTSNDGKTQYYFTPNQVTVVNWLTNGQAANTHELEPDRSIVQVMNYHVVDIDETNAIVRIRFETPLNWVEERLLHFTANRQTLTEWLDIMGHRLSDQWVYVGQRQEP